jgi:hypothetical protein
LIFPFSPQTLNSEKYVLINDILSSFDLNLLTRLSNELLTVASSALMDLQAGRAFV